MKYEPELENRGGRCTAARLGAWCAALAAILSLLFAVLALAFPASPWAGIEVYAETFATRQMLSMVPALALAPVTVLAFAGLHSLVTPEKRFWSLSAFGFAVVYTTIVAANYLIQLHAVRLGLLYRQLDGLTLLAMPNLRSVFFSLEAIGYGFLGLSTLVAAPVFSAGNIETWIRRLFVLNGASSLFGVVVAPFDFPMIIFAGLALWVIIYPMAMVLLALWFRRQLEAEP